MYSVPSATKAHALSLLIKHDTRTERPISHGIVNHLPIPHGVSIIHTVAEHARAHLPIVNRGTLITSPYVLDSCALSGPGC